jgi:hypothetical protein
LVFIEIAKRKENMRRHEDWLWIIGYLLKREKLSFSKEA